MRRPRGLIFLPRGDCIICGSAKGDALPGGAVFGTNFLPLGDVECLVSGVLDNGFVSDEISLAF